MAFDHQLQCDRAAAVASVANATAESVASSSDERGCSVLVAATILLGKLPLLLLVAVLRHAHSNNNNNNNSNSNSNSNTTNALGTFGAAVWDYFAAKATPTAKAVGGGDSLRRGLAAAKKGTVLGWQPSLPTIGEDEPSGDALSRTNANSNTNANANSNTNANTNELWGEPRTPPASTTTASRLWNALIVLFVLRMEDVRTGNGWGSTTTATATATASTPSPSPSRHILW
eukprot:jgi/Psemu1/10250/gm1.10250_g